MENIQVVKGARGLPTPAVKIDESELLQGDDHHNLLEPRETINYSASVMQRALLAWIHLGKKNDFRFVCDYYHRLEELEETFPPGLRKESRQLEYELLEQSPHLSVYLEENVAVLSALGIPPPWPAFDSIWPAVAHQPWYNHLTSEALAAALGVKLISTPHATFAPNIWQCAINLMPRAIRSLMQWLRHLRVTT